MAFASRAELLALGGIPVVQPGDDLAALIADALQAEGVRLRGGDVIVVAQKIVSKAEDRFVALATVTPSDRAIEIAARPQGSAACRSDPVRVRSVSCARGAISSSSSIGLELCWRMPASTSPMSAATASDRVLLLPRDPDRSARALRDALTARYGCYIAVVVNDSVGRAWRRGTVGIALGAAGLPSLLDMRGQPDLFGRHLRSSIVGLADEIAATASLLMGRPPKAGRSC